ncbi:MAG: hypothetical protein EON58_10415 [Alphaproteobacteria bacterium]|nr:MAG: hypothetical protein EON58_10415 [Alphaproteobacteria bacterium]
MMGHLKAVCLLSALAAKVMLAGCGDARETEQAQGLSDAQIIEAIAQRPSMQLGQHSYAVAPVSNVRDIEFVVRRTVGDRPIACGYARLPPAGKYEVEQPVVFVADGETVVLQEDLPADQFSEMQDDLCGADWVKPIAMQPPIANVR